MAKYIAITGTHSTGKSTFVEHVTKIAVARGLRVEVVKDNASECLDAGFGILKDHTFQSTLWIMATVIREEQEKSLKADLVIVDRPVSDAIGYLEAALSATERSLPADELNYLYVLAKLHTPRYDLLFKSVLDERIPLGPDRDPDLGFRKDVDLRISKVLSTLGVSPLDPSADDHVAKALALVDSLAKVQKAPAMA
ncbi:AAA family ATPase [Stenotrophomonas maltophilia]|uniref:AAA family ATPase n=1 Tax=Stenotrophomonas maltophilia TaxID=40324 RepID=UPI004041BAF0